ncbi:MAG: hypothetical protein EB060_00910 [Proteobacteria bacterium]|nr:hypothetical protein [Pseudomonadota bacterium]
MESNIAVLLSAILGALAGGVANMWLEARRRNNEMMGLANAFYGEVVALLTKVEQRKYVQELRDAAKKGRRVLLDAKQNYFAVYERNCEKLGLLPPDLTVEIAKFYIYAKAFIDDTDTYCSLEKHEFLNPKKQYNDMADLLEEIGRIGMRIIGQVGQMNKRYGIVLQNQDSKL